MLLHMHPAYLCHEHRNWHWNRTHTMTKSQSAGSPPRYSLSPYQNRTYESTANSFTHNNHQTFSNSSTNNGQKLTFSNFSTNVQLVCATSAGLTSLLNLGCRKLIPELPTLGDTAAVSNVLSPPNTSCCSEVWSRLQW